MHHCATNFRDKYFTDGHYAGARVFARYKLWMTAATAATSAGRANSIHEGTEYPRRRDRT